jgi:hypothetical protein
MSAQTNFGCGTAGQTANSDLTDRHLAWLLRHAETDAFAADCSADVTKPGHSFSCPGNAASLRPMYQIEDNMPKGWVRPVAKPNRESLKARVAELRAELAETEAQLKAMEDDARLEALVKIRNLMRGFELTPADLGLVPAPKRRGRPGKAAP